jgi:5-methylcytosine-specific restriction protein A
VPWTRSTTAPAAPTPTRGVEDAVVSSARWKALRAAVLRDQPLCRTCVAAGRTEFATQVDHVVPVRVRPDLAFEGTNLQPLLHRLPRGQEPGGAPGGGGAHAFTARERRLSPFSALVAETADLSATKLGYAGVRHTMELRLATTGFGPLDSLHLDTRVFGCFARGAGAAVTLRAPARSATCADCGTAVRAGRRGPLPLRWGPCRRPWRAAGTRDRRTGVAAPLASVPDAEWAAMRCEVAVFGTRPDPWQGGPQVSFVVRGAGTQSAPVRFDSHWVLRS